MFVNPYPLFFAPVFQERIWGGGHLPELLGHSINHQTIGEAWCISDHPNGRSLIQNGPYANLSLGIVLEKHPEWFSACKIERFPLLVKMLDANRDLSIQVHPDDCYARHNLRNETGKAECWYILEAEPDSKIIYGHTAQSRPEFTNLLVNGQWDELLVTVSVKKGDFIYVPPGTLHAIGRGLVVLEIQQSSDATYRAYDYDRVDSKGKKRELHIQHVEQITTVPSPTLNILQTSDASFPHLHESDYFRIEKWHIHLQQEYQTGTSCALLSVIAGEGQIRFGEHVYSVRRGDHLMLPRSSEKWLFDGDWQAIAAFMP